MSGSLIFSPVLWSHSWGIASDKFKVHNIMIWCMYILRNNNHRKLTSITSPSYKLFFFLGQELLRSSFFTTFKYTVQHLAIVTMLYITSLEFIHLYWDFVLFDHHLPIPTPPPPPAFSNHQSDLLLWVWVFVDSTYKWDHVGFVFLGLTYST